VERGRANRLQYVWVCLCALRRVLALHGAERARSEGDEGRQCYSHRDVSQLGKWLLELLSFFLDTLRDWVHHSACGRKAYCSECQRIASELLAGAIR